jgi:prepilin-type N-terminal cleavage/methylation domain-containing protein
MRSLLKNLNRNEGGFTLVELVIAIAIIGILSSTIVLKTSGLVSSVEASSEVSKTVQPAAHSSVSGQTSQTDEISAMDDIESPVDLETAQTSAEATAGQMELKIIQTGVDVMMIQEGLTSVKATGSTSDMANFPVGNPLYPKYLRNQTGKGYYSCDSTGQVREVK